MSSKRGIVGTDGFDWRERFELIDARLRHARRGGDYEFVITSDHPFRCPRPRRCVLWVE